jgi:hypothetical protein
MDMQQFHTLNYSISVLELETKLNDTLSELNLLNDEIETGKQPNQDERTAHNESDISNPRTDAKLSGQNCSSKIQPPSEVCITYVTPNPSSYESF